MRFFITLICCVGFALIISYGDSNVYTIKTVSHPYYIGLGEKTLIVVEDSRGNMIYVGTRGHNADFEVGVTAEINYSTLIDGALLAYDEEWVETKDVNGVVTRERIETKYWNITKYKIIKQPSDKK